MKYLLVLFFVFLCVTLQAQYGTEFDPYVVYEEEEKEDGYKLDGLVFFGVIVVTFLFALYSSLSEFHRFLRNTPQTRVKIMFILGLRMMSYDRDDLRGQVNFLFRYILRRYPDYKGADLRKKYATFTQQKIDEQVVFKWLLAKASEEERIQVVDFLADMAYQNHKATRNELRFLYFVAKHLQIDIEYVRSLIGVREKANQEYYQRSQQATAPNQEALRKQKIKQNLHILGLTYTKDFETVKRAYRKLARTMHPDRFHRSSKEEQAIAHERFTAINVAYEELENLLKK